MHCRFELIADGDAYFVKLSIESGAEKVAPFRFDFSRGSRTAPVIRKIDSGSCVLDDLLDVGSELWSALCPPELAPLFRQARETATDVLGIGLDIPFALDGLPWEAMYDVVGGRFLCSDPDVALYRVPSSDTPPPAAPSSAGELKLLTLVPERSGLQTPYEWSVLQALSTHGVKLEPLDGMVTVERVTATLKSSPFEILHYIGHGNLNDRGVLIRLNDQVAADHEKWIDAPLFANMFIGRGIQLAVMNCCLSAPSVSRRLSGLGPQMTRTARIPAVVAMRYEINDTIAIQFAEAFYGELFAGKRRGRVDLAMQAARLTLMSHARKDTIRGFITPILYLAPGREQLFPASTPAAAEAPAPRPVAAAGRPALSLPPKLVSAFRGGRCIPVIGSEIHAYSQVRRDAAAPTLRQVILELAAAWSYPEVEEVQFAERAGEGFISVIFPRIFQHFEQGKERAEIIAAIRKMCSTRRGSPLLDHIAAWNVPGIVYTHIDGLMMLALNNRANVRVMNAIEVDREAQNITSTVGRHVSGGAEQEPLLLVNLRGSLNDPGSLVLTESDHEVLEERLSAKGGEVGSLLKGDSVGRSLLFIGVHPRDPIVRRLCKSHLSDAKRVLRFFVTPRQCAVDESYWHDLDVQWIYADPAAVVEALSTITTEDEA